MSNTIYGLGQQVVVAWKLSVKNPSRCLAVIDEITYDSPYAHIRGGTTFNVSTVLRLKPDVWPGGMLPTKIYNVDESLVRPLNHNDILHVLTE